MNWVLISKRRTSLPRRRQRCRWKPTFPTRLGIAHSQIREIFQMLRFTRFPALSKSRPLLRFSRSAILCPGVLRSLQAQAWATVHLPISPSAMLSPEEELLIFKVLALGIDASSIKWCFYGPELVPDWVLCHSRELQTGQAITGCFHVHRADF